MHGFRFLNTTIKGNTSIVNLNNGTASFTDFCTGDLVYEFACAVDNGTNFLETYAQNCTELGLGCNDGACVPIIDLVALNVTSFIFNNTNGSGNISFSIAFENNNESGASAIFTTDLFVFRDGSFETSSEANYTLAPGQVATISSLPIFANNGDDIEVQLRVDANDTIPETNENNNNIAFNFIFRSNASPVDLIALNVTPTAVKNPNGSVNVSFEGFFSNSNTSNDSVAFEAELFVFDKGFEVDFVEFNYTLVPGEVDSIVSNSLTFTGDENLSAVLIIDRLNIVAESNENNNVAEESFIPLTVLPNIVVEDLRAFTVRFNGDYTFPGSNITLFNTTLANVTVQGTVKNVGIPPANNFSASLSAFLGLTTYDFVIIPNLTLLSGESLFVNTTTFTLPTPFVFSSELRADINNVVAETNETDNSLFKQFSLN